MNNDDDEISESELFADLRADKQQQALEASEEEKCGTCRFFVVKPPEVEIARMARPMYRCGPGSQCSGGPVRGMCTKWRERGAANPQMESTEICDLYRPGGPSVLGMPGQESLQTVQGGSFQKDAATAAAAAKAEAGTNGALLSLGTIGALAIASWWANRR